MKNEEEVKIEDKVGFFEKLKGVLFSPKKTFQKLRDRETFFETFLKFYLIILLIIFIFFTLLGAITFYFVLPNFLLKEQLALHPFPVSYGVLVPLMFIFFIVGGISSALISGLILHIFVRIVAGKGRSYKSTIQVVMYAYTPIILFWWVPFLNIFTPVWSFILTILGLREFHQTTTERAILIMILPLILTFLIGGIWILFFTR